MTKTADCLIEIHAEELPPKAQQGLADALCQQVTERLQKLNVTFGETECFASPRHLAVIIHDLAAQQPDQVVERRGPAVSAAFDKEGKATKACEGFARSLNITPQELMTLKTEQGEWVGYQQAVKGQSVTALLPDIVEQSIQALPIAKRMRWGDSNVEFVRPVHSVILLYGNEVVDATILGCKAGRTTAGHRFLGETMLKIEAPDQYEKMLEQEGKVIASFAKRKEKVKESVLACLEKTTKQGHAVMGDALLNEVTSLVEYPVGLCGTFDEDFLKVPKEVLISAMQDHQRYFPVVDKQDKLLPYFVTVSNIKSKNPEQVIHGNERVLRARLADAKFFYDSDQHERLSARVERLKDIVYQAKLGTLHDKAVRLSKLGKHIAKQLGANEAQAESAGLLAKADLVTSMVGEFPELQGVMGEYYALHDGEPKEIAIAIREHYLPRFAGDNLPASRLGLALAIADRLDLLVGSFSIGQIPTGDKDPYGLRRAALGLVRLLVESKAALDLRELIQYSIQLYQAKADIAEPVLHFTRERMRAWYQDQAVTPDVFAAVAALDVTNLLDFHKRIHAVQAFKKLGEAEALSAANKRVSNILAKYQEKMQANAINPEYFDDGVEKELAHQLDLKNQEILRLCQTGEYDNVLLTLAALRKPVDDFFDKVMVMDERRERRENRILLLTRLREMFLRVADIALLQ